MAKSPFLTAQELDRIRKADAIIREKQMKEFVPEANEYRDGLYLVVGRGVKGGVLGMFNLTILVTEDAFGNKLKKPIRRQVKEGTNAAGLADAFAREVHIRYYSNRKAHR